MSGIGAAAESVVRTASAQGVDHVASTLPGYLRAHRWMQRDNRYRVHVVKKITADSQTGGRGVNKHHVGAYIVASGPLHAMDGWAYLGRSINAQFAGDLATAIHLAYYSELRAAMAILAVAGVGVFNNRHFVIKVNGECVPVPGGPGTHDMVWESLRIWAGTSGAGDLVGRSIAPAGIPIADWCSAHPGLVSWRPVAASWLLAWGVDIKNYSADRDSRNTVSYRPSGLGGPRLPEARFTRDAVVELWSVLEPGDSPFAALDQALLREAIRAARRANGLRSRMSTIATEIVSRVGLSPGGQTAYLNYLVSTDRVPIIDWAADTSRLWARAHVRQVTSRAMLLLRIATGAATELLRRTGISPAAITFWKGELGQNRGLWVGAPPTDLADLWADVEAGIAAMAAGSASSYLELKTLFAEKAPALAETERAVMWGLLAN